MIRGQRFFDINSFKPEFVILSKPERLILQIELGLLLAKCFNPSSVFNLYKDKSI